MMTANVTTAKHLKLDCMVAGSGDDDVAYLNVKSPKFGDDDLATKRRKDLQAQQQQQLMSIIDDGGHNDDEYGTIFSQRWQETSAKHGDGPASLDFNGGPCRISHAGASTPIKPSHGSQSITAQPSDSSFGFHNTFNVLERQMQLNKQPKLNQKQIEYLLHENNNANVVLSNPIYVDIPISDESYHRAISGMANGSFDDANDAPDLFELELEAMQRVKQLLHGQMHDSQEDEIDAAATTANRSGSGHMVQNAMHPSLLEDFYQQDGGDYSNYVYHVARRKNGQVYLRVVRSLLVDKGNFFFIT